MGLLDKLRTRIWDWLQIDSRWGDKETTERLSSMAINSDYYFGHQRRQLKVRVGQGDDNVAMNYTKLMVNKGVALLLGKGIEFELSGDEEEEPQVYINKVWKANKKDILLQDCGQYGGLYGTNYIKILPDMLEAEDGKFVPRLIALNPLHWEIETEEEDIDKVIRYVGRFVVHGPDGNETARRSIVERELAPDGDVVRWWLSDYWFINGNWELMYDPIAWDYPFPPILHWKNLPNAGEVYGLPDIDASSIELQDRINLTASNIGKIIKLYASPKLWARGMSTESGGNFMDWPPDKTLILPAQDSEVGSLEMQSDLASSINYLGILRQAFFDTTQTVDIASVKDKIGQLTNFGLRVIYIDAEAKINGKREVWGEALVELNRRLLLLAEIAPADGGEVVWPDILPVNEAEQMQADQFEITEGLASKQTISKRRGYTWNDEQERIAEEKATNSNIGAEILRAFSQGQ